MNQFDSTLKFSAAVEMQKRSSFIMDVDSLLEASHAAEQKLLFLNLTTASEL